MEEMRALAHRLKIDEQVEFLGWVSRQSLDVEYTRARVVVVPSRWPEPFGMIGLEAMNHARPTIAFRVGGIPDWLEDGVNGLLAEPASVRDLADKIGMVLQDDELAKRLGDGGEQLLKEKFSFDSYITKIEDVFTNVRNIFSGNPIV